MVTIGGTLMVGTLESGRGWTASCVRKPGDAAGTSRPASSDRARWQPPLDASAVRLGGGTEGARGGEAATGASLGLSSLRCVEAAPVVLLAGTVALPGGSNSSSAAAALPLRLSQSELSSALCGGALKPCQHWSQDPLGTKPSKMGSANSRSCICACSSSSSPMDKMVGKMCAPPGWVKGGGGFGGWGACLPPWKAHGCAHGALSTSATALSAAARASSAQALRVANADASPWPCKSAPTVQGSSVSSRSQVGDVGALGGATIMAGCFGVATFVGCTGRCRRFGPDMSKRCL